MKLLTSIMSNRIFILIILIGLILRMATMFYSFQFRENTDILRYRDWARISYLYGISDAYKPTHLSFGTIPTNMPPGSLYSINLMYNLNIQVSKVILKITNAKEGSLSWINGQMIDGFLRFPSIIADLIIGIFIYKIVKNKVSEKNGIIACSLYIFNPVIIYNSAFWGQMDAINNALFYISLYFLIKNKYFFSILFYFLSLYVKLSLLPFFPVFFLILYVLKNRNKLQIISSTALSIFFIYILTLPVSLNPISWIIQFIGKNYAPEMTNITAFAFNFWWFVFRPFISIGKPTTLFNFSEIRLINSPQDTNLFLNIPLMVWGYFIFSLLLIPIIYKLFFIHQKTNYASLIFLVFANVSLLTYLFLPTMHERYLYPIFPLLATYVGLKQKFLSVFLLLSLLNFINLYIVWHPMMTPLMPYGLMNNHFFQWTISFFTVLVSVIFYTKSVKILYAKEK